MTKKHDNTTDNTYLAMIEQVQTSLLDIKEDIREIRTSSKLDRKDLWTALNGLRESITGNSREGIIVRVDRNTSFRKVIIKLLWAALTPLYGGVIGLIIKTLFF